MTTTVSDPPYGSVESYARILRRVRRENLDGCALGVVQMIAADAYVGLQERIDRISNVVSAAEQVAAQPADPIGLAYTGADDGEQPQPIGGREPLHGGMTDEGLVDETGGR